MATPLLTVLNYSAGVQSSGILWMVLLGVIPRPRNFVVVRANPGMENSRSIEYAEMMEALCRENGIETHVAEGPNLYEDILALGELTRFDNPPYWTRPRPTGQFGLFADGEPGVGTATHRVGQLTQCCTKKYKIAPIDRLVRRILHDRYGIHPLSGHVPERAVEKWIGFTADEESRFSESERKYAYFRYVLAERGITKEGLRVWFRERGLPIPPPSHCNACFSQGLRSLKEMFEERPEDWAQAVAVDDAIRDMRHLGVEEEVYVSRSLVPLRELAERGFMLEDVIETDLLSCDSGACFV